MVTDRRFAEVPGADAELAAEPDRADPERVEPPGWVDALESNGAATLLCAGWCGPTEFDRAPQAVTANAETAITAMARTVGGYPRDQVFGGNPRAASTALLTEAWPPYVIGTPPLRTICTEPHGSSFTSTCMLAAPA
jgi:hypothetical protein